MDWAQRLSMFHHKLNIASFVQYFAKMIYPSNVIKENFASGSSSYTTYLVILVILHLTPVNVIN